MKINYHRKIYALLQSTKELSDQEIEIECLKDKLPTLKEWWETQGKQQCEGLAKTSDRVALKSKPDSDLPNNIEVSHLISGQKQKFTLIDDRQFQPRSEIGENAEKTFWWLWRFSPEKLREQEKNALLMPADRVLPDCPRHSYKSTVSALSGAMFPNENIETPPCRPHLLLFTFSPVQEFIKASRKFLDFWAGSYLLHYLGAKMCWYIAEEYGPDAVITPSLWGQEIIDALILDKYPDFQQEFDKYTKGDPVSKFNNRESVSLSTAGFPNLVTAVLPGKEAAKAMGKKLAEKLKSDWVDIGIKVREVIKKEVMDFVAPIATKEEKWKEFWQDKEKDFTDLEKYQNEFKKWQHGGNWEWNKLWEAQLDNTWESYWTVVPLGDPERDLEEINNESAEEWLKAQTQLSQERQEIPTEAEKQFYEKFNVGTWWGSFQGRLGKSIQAVKNTRTWQIPVAPGERSTLSGQYSAVHPSLHYDKFREGAGMSAGNMRLFWQVMAEAFPGLFNGSEKLNALELTKRMAWVDGGVAKSLGIKIDSSLSRDERYQKYIRFPNLSSIASARFAHDNPQKVAQYWDCLKEKLDVVPNFSGKQKGAFHAKSRHPFQVKKTDKKFKEVFEDDKPYNGMMFSSKWLAEDMNLKKVSELSNKDQISKLREIVGEAHKECGFGESSPSDWWAIVLGDGDNMGRYVNGSKLKPYRDYISLKAWDNSQRQELEAWDNLQRQKKYILFIFAEYLLEKGLHRLALRLIIEVIPEFLKTPKRMGPATHVGLNRALLDFSNRLVPYLTEERCCGRVVYSGGDDVMAVLPVEDLPEYLRSLHAAWQGGEDLEFKSEGGYWFPKDETVKNSSLDKRPYFTMGEGATMSMGIVIAHKSVPLPTVLESLWTAEKERAKKIPDKDGLCFRVIYGSGNTLEALMKGTLLSQWHDLLEIEKYNEAFSPLLYRLAEELPRRCLVTENQKLFSEAAKVIINRREDSKKLEVGSEEKLLAWLDAWEYWAFKAPRDDGKPALGTQPEDLGRLLKFTGYWIDRMCERENWVKENNKK
ncbi:MAG: type III-B CRISPR-associated protein Cas10/Cmr2 [Okeania sp. SIO2F4]|uniref:type III-B CRISPR-associated protein Cas10/Cmr2 n=1 Tax=Okeania sp. SIO2F4 TaxID=2607790 RepID=UPI00142B5FFA|nr:type III-B CRISPR-associated protein Cas10/Cmr2 [Okeania sp. SIO2F4]NES01748.1 type III-B CRISPR-associated protein Cas10/Cmr2 [Okeania sp. SIO2F4]